MRARLALPLAVCLAPGRLSRLCLMGGLSLFLVAPANAAKKDKETEEETEEPTPSPDDFREAGEEEEDDEPAPKRLEEDDKDDETDPDEKADDDFSDDNDDDDLEFNDEDEQSSVKPREAGEDTAQIYRDFEKKVSEYNADEEQIKWEQYLEKYPKSLFRDRIEARMDELSNEMYSERVPGSDGVKAVDGADRELNFANGWHLMGVDPQSKITAGFALGIGNWFSMKADLEYQLMRQLSVHGGVNRGLGGWEIAAGGKYALIKSARTNTILTGAIDLGLFTAPANMYPTVIPTIGLGQRINVLSGLDLALVVSVVPEFHQPINVRYSGGLTAELRANEILYVFAETQANLRDVSGSLFQFHTASFGLRFVPKRSSQDDGGGRAIVGVGADAPYLHDYWNLYGGAVNVDAAYYL